MYHTVVRVYVLSTCLNETFITFKLNFVSYEAVRVTASIDKQPHSHKRHGINQSSYFCGCLKYGAHACLGFYKTSRICYATT